MKDTQALVLFLLHEITVCHYLCSVLFFLTLLFPAKELHERLALTRPKICLFTSNNLMSKNKSIIHILIAMFATIIVQNAKTRIFRKGVFQREIKN